MKIPQSQNLLTSEVCPIHSLFHIRSSNSPWSFNHLPSQLYSPQLPTLRYHLLVSQSARINGVWKYVLSKSHETNMQVNWDTSSSVERTEIVEAPIQPSVRIIIHLWFIYMPLPPTRYWSIRKDEKTLDEIQTESYNSRATNISQLTIPFL